MIRTYLKLFVAVISIQACAVGSAAERPNIILFLVDDMGWMDCGAYGSQYYETPNVDKLATQSMRFTDAYAHPLCSPSRASIMTGQEESRHGIMSAHGHLPPEPPGPQVFQENPSPRQPFLLPKSKRFLDSETVTLAEALRDAGYRTAHMGKWHLGLTEPHWPDKHGFETIFHSAPDTGPPNSTYFAPHNIHPDGEPSGGRKVGNIVDGPDGEHIADRLAREAIKYLKANKDEPFFLNLWTYPVHGPWEAKQEYIQYFAKKKDPTGRQGNPIMAGMLKSMDDSLGEIMKALDELGLSDNTILVFFSDNGGNVKSWSTEAEQSKYLKNKNHPLRHMVETYRQYAGLQPPTNNSPLKYGKAFLYEGGERVPLMVRWPDKIPAGSVNNSIINNIDLYPTLLEMAGVPLPDNHIVDGLSFAPVLLEGKAFPRDTSFTWFPYHGSGISVRKGDWKLIRRFKEDPRYWEGMVELFNLKDDLGETRNLAKQMPEKVAELGRLIDEHFEQTGGLYPVPNPNYNKEATTRTRTKATEVDSLSAARGLVAQQSSIAKIKGGIRVNPKGRSPFLGSAQVKLRGPLTLKLRARTEDGRGGTGRIQWRTLEQKDFPSTGQVVAYKIPSGNDWQDIVVQVPVKGRAGIVRIYLPGAKALEIQSIEWSAKGQGGKLWDFSSVSP
ncbi:MAG: sulfatase [Puniceicoccaceae bacterium]